MLYNEHGISSKLTQCFDRVTKEACRVSGVLVFRDLDKFVESRSGFSNLVLDNFRFILLYYFLFCSMVFVAFCLQSFTKCTKMIRIFLMIIRKIVKKITNSFRFRFRTKTRKVRQCRAVIGRREKIRSNQRRLKNRWALLSGIYRRDAVFSE